MAQGHPASGNRTGHTAGATTYGYTYPRHQPSPDLVHIMNASAVFPFGPIGIREGNAFPRFLKRAHSMHQTAHRGCKLRR